MNSMNSVTLTARRYGKAVAATETVQGTVTTHQLLSRNSHRKFLDNKLSEPLLTYLLACAQSAPSKSDLQQYSIVIVDQLKLRERINNLPGMDDWVRSAPHLLIFCADLYRGWRITKSKGFDNANNTLDMLVNATGDTAIAMMAFVTAVESMGLGCCPVSVVRNQIEEVSALLELPQGVYPFAGLCFGYPAQSGQTSIRLPQDVVVHRNRYDDAELLQHLRTYDDTRHLLSPIPEEKQLHRDRYGTKSGLKWSDNLARRLSVQERKTFRAFLEKQNFALK